MKQSYKIFSVWFLIFYCIGCGGENEQITDWPHDLKPFPIVETGDNVIDPPEGVHPFYKKYINADGIIIVSSDKVPNAALIVSRKTVLHLLSKCPDIHEEMLKHNPRISIMAHSETASDLPEFEPRSDGQWGLGQMPGGPTSLVSEKGVCYEENTEYIANFLLHEFVHMIHNLGIHFADPEVENEIYAAYINAEEKGFFKGPKDEARENITPIQTYGEDEYFTHSVNAWFDLNESLPGPWMDYQIGEWGSRSGTKEELKKNHPAIFEIISRYFPESGDDIIQKCNSKPKNIN
jgi:hypothetical protein